MIQLKNILIYMDEELDLAVLERGIFVAKAYNAKITVVSVVESYNSYALLSKPDIDIGAIEVQLVKSRKKQLINAVKSINRRGVTISTEVLVGDPAISIIQLVQNQDIDLLIKASAPEDGLRKKILGGIDVRLMRACPCPVKIEPQKTTGNTTRAIVAFDYDGNDEWQIRLNDRILDLALLAMSGRHPELYIVHAWTLYGYSILAHGRGKIPSDKLYEMVRKERSERQDWLENRVNRFRETLEKEQAAKFNPTIELLEGKPETVIPQRVDELDADLLGIGTASRSGLKGLLIGNTAEEILHKINCSVVVIKPEDFACPLSSN
jgi:universal stress protein E